MDTNLEKIADKYSEQVSTSPRVHADLFLGRQEFHTVTAIVRQAFLDGAVSQPRAEGPSIRHLQEINTVRAQRWHPKGIQDWSALEWAGAMAGEGGEMAEELLAMAGLGLQMMRSIGEAANAAKKLKREDGDMANLDSRGLRSPVKEEIAAGYRRKIGKEAADTIIYAILLCQRVGVDAQDAIRDVFNAKSEEYGFPERL